MFYIIMNIIHSLYYFSLVAYLLLSYFFLFQLVVASNLIFAYFPVQLAAC